MLYRVNYLTLCTVRRRFTPLHRPQLGTAGDEQSAATSAEALRLQSGSPGGQLEVPFDVLRGAVGAGGEDFDAWGREEALSARAILYVLFLSVLWRPDVVVLRRSRGCTEIRVASKLVTTIPLALPPLSFLGPIQLSLHPGSHLT